MPNFVPFALNGISPNQQRTLLRGGAIRIKHGHYGTGDRKIMVQRRFHNKAQRADGRGGGCILRASDMNMAHAKGSGFFDTLKQGFTDLGGAAEKAGNWAWKNKDAIIDAAKTAAPYVQKAAEYATKASGGGVRKNHLVKGSEAARAHMARLRAMRSKGGNTGSAR